MEAALNGPFRTVAMDSPAEEMQDTYTNREAMCVTIKEWPLDSARMSHRPSEAEISLRGSAAFVLVFPYRLSDKLSPPLFNVSRLSHLNEESGEVSCHAWT